MFGSTILDVAVGLVLVFLLFSLLATTINEFVASVFGLRANKLQLAIRRMLTDDSSSGSALGDILYEHFFSHPLINYMNAGGRFKRKPSYISAADFSKVVIDSLRSVSGISGNISTDAIAGGLKTLDTKSNSETVQLLQSFLDDAGNDVAKFRALLEQWFDAMMERTSGWYKRQVQWITLIVGISIAAAFNASTFGIADRLMKDNSARQELAQLASSYLQSHPQAPAGASDGVKADSTTAIDSLVSYAADLYKTDIKRSNQLLGLGWGGDATANHMDGGHWLMNLLGWIVTAIAISLGSPFWFDLLGKLVQLRGTGPKPQNKTNAK
jgi:hypothetical protein